MAAGNRDDLYYINALRCLFVDIVQGANSGHPGAPMALAPAAHILWGEVMRYDSKAPAWPGRDRFVLSNGHACSLQYGMLHVAGYDLSVDDLKAFRSLNSRTPGHPEVGHTAGIEVTTGPLGQGLANAVGIAMANRHLAARFNKPGFELFDANVYVFCGDGCLQEGISQEAMSLAGHLGLGNLIIVYDDNKITIDGPTNLSFSDDSRKRAESCGFHTVTVEDGNTDLAAIRAALKEAASVKDKPTMISLKTIIGYGSDKANTHGIHGTPLGADGIAKMKASFGRDADKKYDVDASVYSYYGQASSKGAALRTAWEATLEKYLAAHPEDGKMLNTFLAGALPEGWKASLPTYKASDAAIPTRKASEACINAIYNSVPNLFGGAADLAPSCLTKAKGSVDFQAASPEGRYIRYGVREHAMVAIANGIDAHGGLVPFVGTFLNFIGYAMGAVRLSAMSNHGLIFVGTHDCIGVGEDGPTHQPVEIHAALRACPNLLFLRPADGNETSGAYAIALERRQTPCVLALSRQNCPQLEKSSIDAVTKGAYHVHGPAPKDADVLLLASGSEVGLCVEAAKSLSSLKASVISFPCIELFEEQNAEYKASLLPDGVPALSVEAYVANGWERYSHAQLGMNSFGRSAPVSKVFDFFGFTPASVADKATKLVAHYKKAGAPASKLPPALW